MPEILPALGAFFGTGAGAAVAGGLTSAAVGYGVSQLDKPNTHITIPPPPGAALIDPAGQAAAASARTRAAAAGGLQSTITNAQSAPTGPTGGGKSLTGA
jgi:hypothetical protein